MALFETITELKTVVGGAINASMDIDSISPYFQIAHERHMEFWLGNDLLEALETDLAGTPSAESQALLPFYRRALGWLTVAEYLPFAAVQLGESGLHRIETDSHKTGYKYQEAKYDKSTLTNGYEALEKLLIFLDARRSDYPGWELAPGYELYHGQFMNTATAFRMVSRNDLSRQVFEVMFGIAKEVEEQALVPLIGQAQYDALLIARRDGDWTSEALEKKIILMCQRISAHFTLVTALKQHLVRLEGNRVVQLEFLEDQGVPKEGAPTLAAVGIRLDSHDETANAYIRKLRALLDANAEDPALTDYAAWLVTLAEAEQAYQAARETAAYTPFEGGQGGCYDLSERYDGGNAFGFGTGDGTRRKGVGRF